MKQSKMPINASRNANDARVISHALMLRAGYVRQVQQVFILTTTCQPCD